MSARHEVEARPKVDLDQWVVKGLGKHRGQYLMRQWFPTRATWVPERDQANRFRQADADREARAHGGVAVELVAPMNMISRVSALEDFIFAQAAGAAPRKRLHWIHGVGELRGSKYTEGDCFCFECATATVEKIRKRHPRKAEDVGLCVDGGWGSEEDGLRFCELCGAPLQHSLTDYGAEEELNHFLAYPLKRDEPEDWAAISLAVQNLPRNSPLWSLVAMWVDRARGRSRKRGTGAKV